MRLPIRVRMTALHVTLLALTIAALGAFLVVRLHADLVASIDRQLAPAVAQIGRGYHSEGPSEARDVAATALSGDSAAAQVLTPDGRVTAAFGDRVATTPMLAAGEIRAVLAGGDIVRTMSLGSARRSFRVHAVRTTRGRYPRVAVAAESMASTDRSVHRLLMLLLLAGPFVLATSALGGWLLARRSLRPVASLTSQAELIGMDRLADRLPVGATGDEVARLATTLNTMLARIESGVQEQHRLVADASHELRTPLAAMRAELDVSLRADDLEPAARAVLISTLEEVERLSETVDALLMLARADVGKLDLAAGDVDLATVAGATIARFETLAADRGVALIPALQPATVRGDRERLAQAIGNLLANAIEFSPPGGIVTVTTRLGDGEGFVEVRDEGPGIPPAEREAVFDRFHRLDPSRTRATGGSGIGLALVREIASAHGGRAWVDAAPRGGSVFTLAVPAAPTPPRPARGRAVSGRAW